MKLITQQASQAMQSFTKFNSSNTKVYLDSKGTAILSLFNNDIAYLSPNGKLSITNRNYFTATTKERLNGLTGVQISQRSGVWYLNGKVWDGQLIAVN